MADNVFSPKTVAVTQYRWSNTANWSSESLPDQNGTTVLTSDAAGYDLFVDGSYTVGSLIFGTGSGELTVSLQSGVTLDGDNADSVAAGSTVNLVGGGTFEASGLEVDSGATLNVQSVAFDLGGSGLTLGSGSSADFSSAGTLNLNTLTVQGPASLTLGGASQTSIENINGADSRLQLTENGGYLQLGSGASGTVTVSNSGTIEFTGSPNGVTTFQLQGGTILLDGNANLQSGDVFDFSGNTASTLDVLSTNNFQNGFGYAISGFDYGDKLEFGSLDLTNDGYSYSSGSSTLTITSGGRDVLQITDLSLGGNVASTPSFDLSGNTITLVCFLSGSLIETDLGSKPVEHLRVGERVITLEGVGRAARPVRWVGHQLVTLPEDCDETDYPVCIRADAFGPARPAHDLLVTSEHCIYVDGVLIPARMLVNGSSILHDTRRRSFGVHHVELDRHSVIFAEGLPTESYLDTGNRGSFGMPRATEKVISWREDAAAPLETRQEMVEPIWKILARRAAEELALPVAPATELTDEPDLRVLLDDQQTLAARWVSDDQHLFHIPTGRRATHLLSRAARPSHIIGPFVDDRRLLGVSVRQISLWNGLCETILGSETTSGPGWHAPDGTSHWTDGRATLTLPPAHGETCFLDIRIDATLSYPIAPTVHAETPVIIRSRVA